MNWSNLSDQDRALAIISVVQTTVNVCKDVASMIQKIRGKPPGSVDFQIECVKWNQSVGTEAPKVNAQETDASGVVKNSPILGEKGIEGVNSEKAEMTIEQQMGEVAADTKVAAKAAKTYSLAEAVCGSLMVVVNVASAVCIGFQIKEDFDTNQPTVIKVLVSLSCSS